MSSTELAEQLEQRIEAFENSTSANKRESREFQALNDGIRQALKALGENALDITVLESRGLASGAYDEEIPDTYLPAVRQLVEDLRA